MWHYVADPGAQSDIEVIAAIAAAAAGTVAGGYALQEARRHREDRLAAEESGTTAALYRRYHEDTWKHASLARYATLVTGAAGLVITMLGVLMMLTRYGSATEGAVSTSTGLVMQGAVAFFYRYSTQQLKASQESFKDLRDDQRREMAMNMVDQIDDEKMRNAVRAAIALQGAGYKVSGAEVLETLFKDTADLTLPTTLPPQRPEADPA